MGCDSSKCLPQHQLPMSSSTNNNQKKKNNPILFMRAHPKNPAHDSQSKGTQYLALVPMTPFFFPEPSSLKELHRTRCQDEAILKMYRSFETRKNNKHQQHQNPAEEPVTLEEYYRRLVTSLSLAPKGDEGRNPIPVCVYLLCRDVVDDNNNNSNNSNDSQASSSSNANASSSYYWEQIGYLGCRTCNFLSQMKTTGEVGIFLGKKARGLNLATTISRGMCWFLKETTDEGTPLCLPPATVEFSTRLDNRPVLDMMCTISILLEEMRRQHDGGDNDDERNNRNTRKGLTVEEDKDEDETVSDYDKEIPVNMECVPHVELKSATTTQQSNEDDTNTNNDDNEQQQPSPTTTSPTTLGRYLEQEDDEEELLASYGLNQRLRFKLPKKDCEKIIHYLAATLHELPLAVQTEEETKMFSQLVDSFISSKRRTGQEEEKEERPVSHFVCAVNLPAPPLPSAEQLMKKKSGGNEDTSTSSPQQVSPLPLWTYTPLEQLILGCQKSAQIKKEHFKALKNAQKKKVMTNDDSKATVAATIVNNNNSKNFPQQQQNQQHAEGNFISHQQNYNGGGGYQQHQYQQLPPPPPPPPPHSYHSHRQQQHRLPPPPMFVPQQKEKEQQQQYQHAPSNRYHHHHHHQSETTTSSTSSSPTTIPSSSPTSSSPPQQQQVKKPSALVRAFTEAP